MRPIDFKGCQRCNSIVVGWVCEICGHPLAKDTTERIPAGRAMAERGIEVVRPKGRAA